MSVQLVLQVFATLLLAFWYKSSPEQAYSSIWSIRAHPFPSFILSLQYWGCQIFFLHGLLHLLMMLRWGTCSSEWVPRWFLSIITLMAGYAILATGNFLLFDRHGVQSAVIEVSIVDRIPLFGPVFADWVRGGASFGAGTLTLWNVAFRWIPALLLIAYIGVAIFYRRYDDESQANWRIITVGSMVPILAGIFLQVPLGARATSADYNGYDAVVNWYAWPLHGSLKAFSAISPSLGWIGALVLPAVFIALLFYLPWLCNRVTQVFAQAIIAIFGFLFLALSVLFGGFPASPFSRDLPKIQVASEVAEPNAPISNDLFQQGKVEFGNNGCADCHGVDGSTGNGGPDLTQINKEHPDLKWYIAWIRDPSRVKPGATMPAYPKLTDQQLTALGEYLRKPR
jgi:quinol-cytochrome oxidoreductase complex cytochrome b subunit